MATISVGSLVPFCLDKHIQPLPATAATRLRWSGGYDEMRPTGKGQYKRQAGGYVPYGINEELTAALDAAQLPLYDVMHRAGGETEVVHFLGEAFVIYPLISGVTVNSMLGIKGKERKLALCGVGNSWRPDPRSGRNNSRVALRGYLYAAAKHGYIGLVQLQLSGHQSDCALAALIDHCRLVGSAASVLGRPVSPVEVACALGAGPEKTVGRGEKSSPMVPLDCTHPRSAENDYIERHLASDAIATQAALDWPQVVQWALDYSTVPDEDEKPDEPLGAPTPVGGLEPWDVGLEGLQ